MSAISSNPAPRGDATVPMAADPSGPEPHGGVKELTSGVDALYLSGRAQLSASLFEVLEERRLAAEAADEPVPLNVAGVEFFVHPRAFGKYRYRLTHERGMVGVTTSENLPALRVQPRAEFLHGAGPLGVLEFFGDVGEYLAGGPVYWSLSRLDLFCDVQGWDLHGDERHRFMCRAQRRDLHEHGAEFGGFEFGRRTSQTVCARIYDKTRQIESKGLDYWPVIWGERYDRAKPVLRIEAEIGRQGLVEYGVDSPTEGSTVRRRSGATSPRSGSPTGPRQRTRPRPGGRSHLSGKRSSSEPPS